MQTKDVGKVDRRKLRVIDYNEVWRRMENFSDQSTKTLLYLTVAAAALVLAGISDMVRRLAIVGVIGFMVYIVYQEFAPGKKSQFTIPDQGPFTNKFNYDSPEPLRYVIDRPRAEELLAQFQSEAAFQKDYVKHDQIRYILGGYRDTQR